MNGKATCSIRNYCVFAAVMLMVFAVCAARSEAQLAKSAPIGYGDRPQKGSIKLDLQVDEDSSVYTKTVMVKLEKLDAAEVEPFVKKSLSKYGSVSVNSQANNLVITDIEPKLSDLVAFVKDMDSLGIENFVQLETEVIKLNNVQASSLVNILKERLSGEGTLESDDSLNVLVVTDVRGKIDYVKDIIEKLDMPPEQIIIEAKIVEVSDTDFSDVGIDLTALLDAGNLALGTSKSSNKQLEYQEPVTQSNRYKNSLINGTSSLDEVINTLVGTGKAKLLANPRIVTLNNKSGSISIQSDMLNRSVDIRRSYSTNGSSGDTYDDESGSFRHFPNMSLIATPHIGAGGLITIDFTASAYTTDSSPDSTKDSNITDRGDTKSLQSSIIVKQGETFVVGGLDYELQRSESRKTPILGSIPIIKEAFTKKIKIASKSKVLFFLTPKIIANQSNPPNNEEKAMSTEDVTENK